MAIAPSVIQEAMVEIVDAIPGAIYAGIVGDVNHSFGYHLAPEDLPATDYSRQLARDRSGVESNAASALDITNRTPELWATTARLRAAAKAGDPRLYGLREFAGTLDGVTTYAFDLSTGRESFGTWDSTHLFHNHLSGYRDCTRNRAAWLAVAEVMIGATVDGGALQPTTPPAEEDTMAALGDAIKIIQPEDPFRNGALYILGVKGWSWQSGQDEAFTLKQGLFKPDQPRPVGASEADYLFRRDGVHLDINGKPGNI